MALKFKINEKRCNVHHVTSVRQRENMSLRQESNLLFYALRLDALTTELRQTGVLRNLSPRRNGRSWIRLFYSLSHARDTMNIKSHFIAQLKMHHLSLVT